MQIKHLRKHRIIAGTIVFAIVFSLVSLLTIGVYSKMNKLSVLVSAVESQLATPIPFPDIDEFGFSAEQKVILGLVKNEYSRHPSGFDENVLKYTQGNREAWCADFSSWVMLKAGLAYENPNSGSWRIPGVYTLKEYYQSRGRYVAVGKYVPKFGDVAIYDSRQTHDQSNNVHVAIVLVVHDGKITTIGGNEGGRMLIARRALQLGENGLVGFGRLP